MKCIHCQYQNRPDAKFCRGCGRPLTLPTPPAQPTCVNCGQALRPNARFCKACGAAQPAISPVPSMTPVPPPVAPPASSPYPSSPSSPRSPVPPPSPTPLPARPSSSPPPLVYSPAPGFPSTTPHIRPSTRYFLQHALLSGVLIVGLLLALTAAFAHERLNPIVATPLPPPIITPGPSVPAPQPTADYRQAVVEIGYTATGRFGLRALGGDPATNTDDGKALTFSATGETNNTRLWVDGETLIYGGDQGLLDFFTDGGLTEAPHLVDGQVRSILVSQEIEVTQILAYVYGSSTGRVDTMQIKYVLTNQGSATREVGLRLMLDTLIGDNDGVPFVVPGRTGITDRAIDLRGADVPDFIQALEFPNLTAPGVIVHLTLQGADATRPDRLVISAWCDENSGWDDYSSLGGDGHPLARCGGNDSTPDSAVWLYFDPQPLPPNQSRTIITYYGLGGISSTATQNTRLSLTFNRTVHQGDTFWVTALVTTPQAGQTIRLDLPAGLAFAAGYEPEQPVPSDGDYTQVSWQVTANDPFTDGSISVTLNPDNISESQSITVQARGITR